MEESFLLPCPGDIDAPQHTCKVQQGLARRAQGRCWANFGAVLVLKIPHVTSITHLEYIFGESPSEKYKLQEASLTVHVATTF